MSLADSLKPTQFAARSIAGRLGFRPHSVALVAVSTSGTHTGDGSRTEIETEIVESGGQPCRVRWLKDDEVALGQLPMGTVEVGPITPSHTGGGTDLDLLTGADLSDGQVRLLRITGPNHPNGADYTIKSVSADKALRYMVTAVPVGSQGG
jgi:hypothetical protein